MHRIRPYKIFRQIDPPDLVDRIARVPIPVRRGTGGVSLLETFLILASGKIVHAKRIFEFGTFLGSTTLNLALNSPENAEIFTLDFGKGQTAPAQQHAADAPLTEMHLAAGGKFDFSESPVRSKITTLTGDSTTFDFSPWKGSIDLVFIDGGHDLATVRSDTANALQMVRMDGPSCVLWHDYRNPEYPELTQFLDELSQRLDIFHIEDTMLSVRFSNPEVTLRDRLLSNE
jgi:hypothetical protein